MPCYFIICSIVHKNDFNISKLNAIGACYQHLWGQIKAQTVLRCLLWCISPLPLSIHISHNSCVNSFHCSTISLHFSPSTQNFQQVQRFSVSIVIQVANEVESVSTELQGWDRKYTRLPMVCRDLPSDKGSYCRICDLEDITANTSNKRFCWAYAGGYFSTSHSDSL